MVCDDGYHRGEIVMIGPDVEEGLFRRTPNFPRKSACRRKPATVFAELDGSGRGELPTTGFPLGGEFNRKIIIMTAT